jgi:hypothetical protein
VLLPVDFRGDFIKLFSDFEEFIVSKDFLALDGDVLLPALTGDFFAFDGDIVLFALTGDFFILDGDVLLPNFTGDFFTLDGVILLLDFAGDFLDFNVRTILGVLLDDKGEINLGDFFDLEDERTFETLFDCNGVILDFDELSGEVKDSLDSIDELTLDNFCDWLFKSCSDISTEFTNETSSVFSINFEGEMVFSDFADFTGEDNTLVDFVGEGDLEMIGDFLTDTDVEVFLGDFLFGLDFGVLKTILGDLENFGLAIKSGEVDFF